ncbi:MAG: LysM peptidoglycan-binding domain-containing protein, partial [Acidimicrobiia bacterium]|nr:LysM peptidoglycan-binding domain-containing protein [Acidimicrobiia bacterium]
ANPIGSSYRVEKGDSLWTIAARVVSEATGGTPDDRSIARYWRLLVAENTSALTSGDPDMIYPGETVVVPPMEE